MTRKSARVTRESIMMTRKPMTMTNFSYTSYPNRVKQSHILAKAQYEFELKTSQKRKEDNKQVDPIPWQITGAR